MRSRENFDQDLNQIRSLIVHMGRNDCLAIEGAIKVLVDESYGLINEVRDQEKQVDLDYEKLDEIAIRTIALHQPIASDLRLIIASVKIASELERVGDYANNIVRTIKRSRKEKDAIMPEAVKVKISELADESLRVLRKSIEVYGNLEVESLQELACAPDAVGKLKKQMEDEVAIWAAQDLNSAQSALRIYKIGRYLERVVDRSANISEWIWYQVYGTRMRRGE